MKYTPKSIYRVNKVAWGAYKRTWRGGFSPVEGNIVQALAQGMMENKQKPHKAELKEALNPTRKEED